MTDTQRRIRRKLRPKFKAKISTLIIMATVAIDYKSGIMVHGSDVENLSFKRAVLEHFQRSKNCKLIIAADAHKFIAEKHGYIGVLEEKAWATMLSKYTSIICVVTTALRPDIGAHERAEFEKQLALFRGAQITIDS